MLNHKKRTPLKPRESGLLARSSISINPRVTRSLSPPPSRISFDKTNRPDLDSTYKNRLFRSTELYSKSVDDRNSTELPLQNKLSSFKRYLSTDDQHNSKLRKSDSYNCSVDSKALDAMEMEAFVLVQQNVTSLCSRIDSALDWQSLADRLISSHSILAPIGLTYMAMFSLPASDTSSVLHQSFGRNDAAILLSLRQAFAMKDASLHQDSQQVDALFPNILTITPASLSWNDYYGILFKSRESHNVDGSTHPNWKSIYAVPLSRNGDVVAVLFVAVDAEKVFYHSSKGHHWQEILTLQLLQQLCCVVERRLSWLHSERKLTEERRKTYIATLREFSLKKIQEFALLNATQRGLLGTIESMLKSAVGFNDVNENSKMIGNSWLMVEQRPEIVSTGSQSQHLLHAFSYDGSHPADKVLVDISSQFTESTSKQYQMSIADLLKSQSMRPAVIRNLSVHDLLHRSSNRHMFQNNDTSRVSNCVVYIPFAAPLSISHKDTILLNESTNQTIRCLMCVELLHNSGLDNAESDCESIMANHIEEIVSSFVHAIDLFRTEHEKFQEAKLQHVLRIVHQSTSTRNVPLEGNNIKLDSLSKLMHLMSAMQSEQVSKCFSVRRSVMLLTNTFMSSLDVSDSPETSNVSVGKDLYFIHMVGSEFQSLDSCAANLGTDDWLQELFNGRPVHFSDVKGNYQSIQYFIKIIYVLVCSRFQEICFCI